MTTKSSGNEIDLFGWESSRTLDTPSLEIDKIISTLPDNLRTSQDRQLIYLPEHLRADIKAYKYINIADPIKKFMHVLLQETSSSLSGWITYEQLKDALARSGLPTGRTGIYNKFKSMKDCGLLFEDTRQFPDKPISTIIQVICPPVINNQGQLSSNKQRVSSNAKALTQMDIDLLPSSTLYVEDPDAPGFYRDKTTQMLMVNAIRSGHDDSRQIIKRTFEHKGERLHVTTTTQTDDKIIVPSDNRYATVLLTLGVLSLQQNWTRLISEGLEPANEFIIDMRDVLKKTEVSWTTKNRNTAYSAIRRLYTTNFNVKSGTLSSTAFAELFDGDEEDVRLVTQLANVKDPSGDNSPMGIKISIRLRTFRAMVRKVQNQMDQRHGNLIQQDPQKVEIFLNHPDLAVEKQDFIHIIHNWIGLYLPRSRQSITTDLISFHRSTSPSTNYSSIVRSLDRSLLSLAQRQGLQLNLGEYPKPANDIEWWKYGEGVNVVKMHGYLFHTLKLVKIKKRINYLMYIERDGDDKYFGTGTAYQKRIAASLATDTDGYQEYIPKNKPPKRQILTTDGLVSDSDQIFD
jgi:hypothetical protein